MKRIKLFLAAMAAMVGLSAQAQSWTSPGSDPVNDGQYYILNVGAGQFVTAANDWGTQLSATGTDTGLLIKTQEVTNVTVAGTSLSGWELLNTNNSNKLLFRDDQRWGYTDKGTQDKGYVWNITKVNGVYRLQTAVGDPAFPAAATQYAGVNVSLNGARVYFGYNSSSSDIDWMFLTEEQKSVSNIVAKARLYRALMKAYAAGVNTDEASAVYENSASTAEELAAAVTTLNNACLQAHLDNASDSDPRDITEFVLSNSDFTQGNITGWETNYVSGKQATNIGYQDNNTYQSANGYVNRFIEAWRSGNAKIGDGYLRQTVSNMPEGKYVLECDAIATNQGNTSAITTGALLYINADGVDFTTSLSTTGSAVQHFSTEFLFSGEGDVIFGLKTQSTTANWIAADNFKVTYYGIDLSAYETQLAAAVAAFEALEGTVPTTTYTTKKTSVVDVNNKEWSSSKEYSTAIAAIQTATSELSTLASAYAEYNTIRAAVLAAYASTDVTAADAAANSASSVEDINTAIATVRTALKNAIVANNAENINLTAALLTNPSFETGDLTGWTNTGMSVQGNESFEKDGSYYVECWQPDGTKSITQVLTGMPAGVYKATATIKARGVSSATLSAGGVSKTMTIGDEQNTYIVEFACDENADVTIKFEGVGTKANSSWLCADNFTLTYVGSLPELTAVDGKMNAEVAAAQTNAVNTYNTTKNVENYNAASAAIAAAESSIAAYATAATALADANALKEAHNFATSEAVTTFAEAIAAAQAKYDAATLTDAEATAGANLGTIVTGWHAGADTPASNYLENGFSLNDFEADLHINTWSIEGGTDGSNFKVPFYEYWIADANSLGEKTWTGTLTNLSNGLYTVSAWVRVRAKNEVAAADATGITMDINGGGEGDYAAVDVTAGEQIGSSQFQIATYTAQGLVKDGTLTLNFNVAADNNISWLSFKNVKYIKVRDLTSEEAATAPTAIALYNGEDEVTAAIELDATTSTVTLTPNYTPADATDGYLTWTSSDVAVATVTNGVVTAVSSGTATITATSTLDNSVSATATVTVSFPETTVPSYSDNGATRTIYHYGENLIKNGSFEYPNTVYGWKDGTRAALSTSNFNVPSTGAYDGSNYLQAKASDGQGKVNSIYTAWPIESGKTYVFSYQIKTNGTAVKESDLGYVGTSLSNDQNENSGKKFDTPNYSGKTSWTEVKYEFTNDDNYNYLVFSARWLASAQSFDNFYLVEKTAVDDVIGNVQYALDAIPTSNIGTGAFQYSQNAIDAANALVQGTATVSDVEAAYDALTTLNAPTAGKLYNIVNITSGFAHAGKALTFKSASDADLSANSTSMAWEAEPGYYMPQGVKFTAVDGTKNGYKLSYTRADGNEVYISTGVLSGLGSDDNQIRPTNDASKALTFVVTSVGDNHWYLYNTAAQRNVGSNGDTGFYTAGGSNKDMKIQEAVNNEVTLNIKAENQYGTIILPFAAEVPTGVTAYGVSELSGNTLTLVEEDAFEANTPYIVYAEAGATETLEGLGSAYTDESYTEGLLTGVYTSTKVPAGKYVLQNNDKVAFYLVEEGEEPTANANRAYLSAPTAGVKAAAYYFGTATAIRSLFNGLQNGDVYDLAGRKVQKMQKGGVYIVNGQKVIVK